MATRNECGCSCHTEWGGGSHPGERCSCKGGTGRDPWGPTRGLAEQTKMSDAVLEDLRGLAEES